MTPPIPALHQQLLHPWRFRLGGEVYVRNRNPRERFRVVDAVVRLGFPHLKLLDLKGNHWMVSQLECSSKPIVFRKG